MGNHEIKLSVWKAGTNLVKVSATEDGNLNSMTLVSIVNVAKIYVEDDGSPNSIYYNVNPINATDDSNEHTVEHDDLMTLDGFLDRYKKEMLQKLWTDRELVDIYCATGVHTPKKRHKGKTKAERKAERKELKKELEINKVEEPTREEKISFCYRMAEVLRLPVECPFEDMLEKDLEKAYATLVDEEYNLRHEDKPKFQSIHMNDGGKQAEAEEDIVYIDEEDCESDN